ncbi:MAG: homospermidine synthase [Legionellaceae bacterium]|nr:homospermidine synthase [Legionellaceae bacterium]MBP9775452.1 homospermidine synthase [Legionellaceae bacterium]
MTSTKKNSIIKTPPQQKRQFDHRILLLGFGSIGRGILPLLLENLQIQTNQITIIAHNNDGANIAKEYGIDFQLHEIKPRNFVKIIGSQLNENDFLVNLSCNLSSAALIKLCDKKGALYIDTDNDIWASKSNENLTWEESTNYMMRETTLKLKSKIKKTAIITHGANPGLASHFVKQALLNIAADNKLEVSQPNSPKEWATLAKNLGIKVIHVAENDTQISNSPKVPNEFVNTWSVDGFIQEGSQPAELGWGTHEKHWPVDAHKQSVGSKCAIYLDRPGARTKVRSWTPTYGPIHGLLVTHAETISLTNFLTLKEGRKVVYRPTVHYAYNACPDALVSWIELSNAEGVQQENQRILSNEIVQGIDELGVLLMGNHKGAYWFGSTLSVEEARKLAPYNSATSLQVVAGVLSGILWALDNPNAGLVEPEDIDHEFVLNVAKPYLGKLEGYYSDWTPLKNRGSLFPERTEQLDHSDPWQFVNIRVS